jgi:predicted dehydrogenase
LLEFGVRKILLEKPLEQSRQRVRELIGTASNSRAAVWCNHYRRTLRSFEPLRLAGGPFIISVSSGAIGLGCNGIHWIDFALHLTGQESGTLLFGEIDPTPIGSGRGAQFRDYGGRGVFGFPDGSRLYLSSAATSSAPTTISIVTPRAHWIVDQQTDRTFVHERAPGASHPTYAYGRDYTFEEKRGLEEVDLSALTAGWWAAVKEGGRPPQPVIADTAVAYELLFDLLETGGETMFHFT